MILLSKVFIFQILFIKLFVLVLCFNITVSLFYLVIIYILELFYFKHSLSILLFYLNYSYDALFKLP
jgi:hypothetical protein